MFPYTTLPFSLLSVISIVCRLVHDRFGRAGCSPFVCLVRTVVHGNADADFLILLHVHMIPLSSLLYCAVTYPILLTVHPALS